MVRRRLAPMVAAALESGWDPAALATFASANTAGIRSPAAVLAARLSLAELPAPAGRIRARPAWCRECSEQTRRLQRADGADAGRCPRCHPLAAGGTRGEAGQATRPCWPAWTAAGDGDQPSLIMVYSGQPIGQPVAMGGPFVMNTKAEITQAFNDLHVGKFGDIPRQGASSTSDARTRCWPGADYRAFAASCRREM
jgi:Pirin C-terminal cupin domain